MNNLLDNSIRFLKRNSSTILTCIGAVGVAATAIMAAKDTIKAAELVKKKEGTDVKLSKKEIIKTAAPAYIPTVVVGISTIACIFGANILNKKTQASLMGAYALLDQSYKEYKDNTKKVFGDEADRRIKESIAKNYYDDSTAFPREDNKQLFFDFHGLQFFNATEDEVLAAEDAVNQMMMNTGYAALESFYKLLGIECVDTDYEVGWTRGSCAEYGFDYIEFKHDVIKNDDGTEFTAITMITEPVEDFMLY